MRQKKKNAAFTFICSFCPGAAEMYMGFMKMGFSLMAVFFLSILLPAMLTVGDISIFLAFLIWFYGFFHARNLAAANEEEFQGLQDKFIWEEMLNEKPIHISGEKGRKWFAAALIVIGLGILWSNFAGVLYGLIPDEMWGTIYPIVRRIPQAIIAIVIIIIGIRMIMGKKEALEDEGE